MKAYPYMHKHPTSGQTTMSDGMDLRDWFAGMAMQSIITTLATASTGERTGAEVCSEEAYIMADAMLKAREVKHEQP